MLIQDKLFGSRLSVDSITLKDVRTIRVLVHLCDRCREKEMKLLLSRHRESHLQISHGGIIILLLSIPSTGQEMGDLCLRIEA